MRPEVVEWLGRNGLSIRKLHSRRPGLGSDYIYAAACKVYDDERHNVRPIRIAWRIWALAGQIDLDDVAGIAIATDVPRVITRIENLEYLVWQLQHPYMHFMDGTFMLGSW